MPRVKWELSNREIRRYRSVARVLNRQGADLDLSAFQTEEALELRGLDCYARSVSYGAVYTLLVSILGLAPKTTLGCFELTSHEFELGAYFLDNPSESRPSSEIYRLLDGTTLHQTEVLNHLVGHTIPLGAEVMGYLLAQSFEPLPEKYKPGDRLPVVLSIADQFGEATRWSIDLRVQPPHLKVRSTQTRRSVFVVPETTVAAPSEQATQQFAVDDEERDSSV
jgi:hypothetical protein